MSKHLDLLNVEIGFAIDRRFHVLLERNLEKRVDKVVSFEERSKTVGNAPDASARNLGFTEGQGVILVCFLRIVVWTHLISPNDHLLTHTILVSGFICS